MREAKGLRNRYNDLGKNITLREDSIQEMLEVMKQYRDRNDDLQTQLDWSRPVKAKLQEPIPTIRDVATLQELIDEHKVGWKLQNCFRSQYSGVNTQESILRCLYSGVYTPENVKIVMLKLQEPIPTVRDVAMLQYLIVECKAGWKSPNYKIAKSQDLKKFS